MLHLIGIGLREAELFKNGGVPSSELPKDFEFKFVRKENNTFKQKHPPQKIWIQQIDYLMNINYSSFNHKTIKNASMLYIALIEYIVLH